MRRALLLGAAMLAGALRAEAAAESCPDTHAWTGQVRNHSFGFTFVIPAGLKGYWNGARCFADAEGCTCMADHGRIVSLGDKPAGVDRQMEMYADYGAEFDEHTASTAARVWLSEHKGTVERNAPCRLGGVPAQCLRVREREHGVWMVEERVISFHPGKSSITYTPYLRTPAKDFVKDESKFRAMIGSFRLLRGDY